MITPGYFLFISIPTRDIDQRSGRWSFVFLRWTAHMTTAFTPASWHRLIFCSRAPMSFFVTTIWTVTMEPHFVYSSSSSYMSRFLWPPSPSCSAGSCPRRPRSAFSESSSSDDRPTIRLGPIILSNGRPTASADGEDRHQEDAGRTEQDRGGVQGVFDRLRQRDDRQGIDDRRHAEEHHEEREEQQRGREGAMRLPASVGVPVNRSDRREREGRAESEEDQDRQDGAMHDQQDPAEEGRSSEGDDLGGSWRERRKDPSDEDPEGRSEDEQGPCDAEEQVSLDAQAERDGVVERHRESEQRKGKEETRRQGRPSRS